MVRIANVAIEVVTETIAKETYNANNHSNANDDADGNPPTNVNNNEDTDGDDGDTHTTGNRSIGNVTAGDGEIAEGLVSAPHAIQAAETKTNEMVSLSQNQPTYQEENAIGSSSSRVESRNAVRVDYEDLGNVRQPEIDVSPSQRSVHAASILKGDKQARNHDNLADNQSDRESIGQSKTSVVSYKPRRHIEFTSKVAYIEPLTEKAFGVHPNLDDPNDPCDDTYDDPVDLSDPFNDPSDPFIDPLNVATMDVCYSEIDNVDVGPRLRKKSASENHPRNSW